MDRENIEIVRINDLQMGEKAIYRSLDGFHVLTYAEHGFSPLSIHGRNLYVDSEHIRKFSDAVNTKSEAGSLHPVAPISAVPRRLVRNLRDAKPLAASIGGFLDANQTTIKASVLIFDFRMPNVPAFIIEALDIALQRVVEPVLRKIVIVGE